MWIDLLLEHLNGGVPKKKLLVIIFIPQDLDAVGHFIKASVKLSDFILAVFIVIAFYITGRGFPASELLDLFNQIIQVVEYMAENQVHISCSYENNKDSKYKDLKVHKLNPVKQGIVIPEIDIVPVHIGNMADNDKFLFIVQCGNAVGVLLLFVACNDFRAVCIVKGSCGVNPLFS